MTAGTDSDNSGATGHDPERAAANTTAGAKVETSGQRQPEQVASGLLEQELQDFFENASVGLHWVGPDGTILRANRAELELLGYTTEEYIGRHIAEFHADPEVIEDILQRLGRGETLCNCEARLRCKDGTIREVLINSNVLWRDGQFVHTRCFTRDITDRKRAERRLVTEHAVSRVLAEASTLEDATPRILEAICETAGWEWGALWGLASASGALRCVQIWHRSDIAVPAFEELSRQTTFTPGVGLPGRVWETGRPAWIADVLADGNFPRRDVAARSGLHGAAAFPVLLGERVLGVMEFFSRQVKEPDQSLLDMMQAIGLQVGHYADRIRAEQALRESEARNAAALEAALDCIVSMDHAGKVIEWNPAAEKTFGYGREEAVGRELASLIIPPTLRQAHRHGLARYLATGEGPVVGRRFEIAAVRQDGSELPVELSSTRLPSQGPPAFIGYLRDIGERRRNEAALRESEERLRLAVAIAQMGTFEIDLRTDAVAVNDPGRDIYGWTAGEPLTFAKVQSYFHQDDRAEVMRRVAEAFRPDGPGEFEVEQRIVRTDGATRWIRVRGRAMFEEVGGNRQAVRCLGTYLDITDEKEAEREREQVLDRERAARSEAERASRMKDEFLATLSHEIRTPLNAILGWSQILRAGPANAQDLARGLETIERNAGAQTRIIEDLLDMSRIISGKVRLDVQRIDLAAVVRSAIDTTQPAADAKDIRLQAVLDPTAGPVSGDPNRLQQVFWNLLTNAVKFTPKGGRVQVLLERVNSHLEVSVIDTGEGIKPEFLPHVFDRFRQADASTTRRHGGLGLGLGIAKQLVELHGGDIRAKSPGVGQGATFTVSLPLTVVHPHPGAEPPAPPPGRAERGRDAHRRVPQPQWRKGAGRGRRAGRERTGQAAA